MEMEHSVRGPVVSRAALLRGQAQAAFAYLDAERRWLQLLSSGIRRSVWSWDLGEQV